MMQSPLLRGCCGRGLQLAGRPHGSFWGWWSPVDWARQSGWTAEAVMYLVNHVALALGLEGTPDPSLEVVQAAVTRKGYTGYVSPDYVAAAPAAARKAPAAKV